MKACFLHSACHSELQMLESVHTFCLSMVLATLHPAMLHSELACVCPGAPQTLCSAAYHFASLQTYILLQDPQLQTQTQWWTQAEQPDSVEDPETGTCIGRWRQTSQDAKAVSRHCSLAAVLQHLDGVRPPRSFQPVVLADFALNPQLRNLHNSY